MERFLESAISVYVMAAITVFGVLGTWITGIYYRQMIKQTENMLSTQHALLMQMKNRFENTYRVNKGIDQIPLFVEKQLMNNRFLWIGTERAKNMAVKAGVLCLLFGGSITVLQQVQGFRMNQVITSMSITLLYTGIGWGGYILSGVEESRKQLQVQLTEYFVNTFSKRLMRAKDDEKVLSKVEKPKKKVRTESAFYSERQGDKNRTGSLTPGDTDKIQNPAAHFTEKDLQYLRQSLERIAAGRDKSADEEKTEAEVSEKFSSKEEKMIDDILKEYFV